MNKQKLLLEYSTSGEKYYSIFLEEKCIKLNIENEDLKNQLSFKLNRGRKIKQFSLDGDELAIYGSITEASLKTGVSRVVISFAVNGHRNSGGGFVWKGVEDEK